MKIMLKLFLILLIVNVRVTLFAQSFVYERTINPAPVPKSTRFSTIAVSQFGDIYLSDIKRHELYRFDGVGKLLNVNGGFGWNEGQFDLPLDLNISSGLNLIVADYNNHRISRYDRKLNYLTTYPDPNSDYSLSFPRSVILTNQGELFILSDEDREIICLRLNQKDVSVFGGVGYGEYALSDPLLIRMDDQGVIHVLEESGRIVQFDRFGTPLGWLEVPANSAVTSLTPVGKDLVVTLRKAPHVLVYSSSQKSWMPLEVAMSKSGYLISAAYRSDKLYLLTSENRIIVYNHQ